MSNAYLSRRAGTRLCVFAFGYSRTLCLVLNVGNGIRRVSLLYAAVQGLRDEFIDKGNSRVPRPRRRKSGYGKVITVSDR